MRYFDIMLEEILGEDLESKMGIISQVLLNDKSRWPGKKSPDPQAAAIEFINFLAEFDPSPNKQYVRYIAAQVAKGNIRISQENPEDGPVIKSVLEIFMAKRKDWPGFKDVFQYKNWRQLQIDTQKYAEATQKLSSNRSSEDAFKERAKEHTKVLFDKDIVLTSGDTKKFRVYKVNDYTAAAFLGRNTTWCTSASLYTTKSLYANETLPSKVQSTVAELVKRSDEAKDKSPWAGWTAENFLAEIYKLNNWPQGQSLDAVKQREFKTPNPYLFDAMANYASYSSYGNTGFLYIIYKDGAPYIQATGDGAEIMNVEDVRLSKASPALARILILISKTDGNQVFLDNVADMIKAGLKQQRPR